MNQETTHLFRTSCGASMPLELKISGPGWDGVEQHGFEQPFLLVGRHERCGLRLEDEAVSRRHAYLQQLGERVFCVDLGSRTGIRWAGLPRPAGWLDSDQSIQIGRFTLELANALWTAEELGEETAANWDPLQDRRNDLPGLPRILIEDGKEVRSQLQMSRMLVLVGSSADCRVRLRDAGISRYHCSLVRTPEGIWAIDLLSATGTTLNGEPITWARLEEGDRLQVGPYLLRVAYLDARSTSPSPRLSTMPAARPDAGGIPGQPGHVQVQTLAVSLSEHSTTEASGRIPELQAELDRLREQLRGAEGFRQQWTDAQAESDRLREQVRTLEGQIAELASLQPRLEAAEASALELDLIRAERDHWQAETQAVRDRVAEDLADKEEEWRQQVEETRRQLAKESEAGRTLEQQLQAAQDELVRSRDTLGSLHVELDQLRERQRESELLGQQLEQTRSQHDQLSTRAQELESQAAEAERLAARLRTVDEETERLRGKVQDAELRLTELETLRTECDRLRALEDQVAELADLKAQLNASEANVLELDLIRAERDHWQAETKSVRDRIAADLAEKEEEWRQQLEQAGKQLAEERESGRAIRERLDEASTALNEARAAFAARNTEHETVSQQLQAAKAELAHWQETQHGLQSELDQLREHQREVETLRQQLEATRSQHDQLSARAVDLEGQAAEAERLGARLRESEQEAGRLGEQIRMLESQVGELVGLRARLDAAQASMGELDSLRAQRDHWQTEARTLQERIAADLTDRELVDRLTADLQAAQAERDRLRSEQQTFVARAEQACNRVSELERQLAETTAAAGSAGSEAPSDWEAERRELQAVLEQERQARDQAIQTAIHEVQSRAEAAMRDVQARAAAERVEWRERLDGAETQIVWERQMFQEQGEQIRRQAASLVAERDRLAARLAQAETMLRGTPERPPEQAPPAVEADPQRQLALRDRVLAELCGFRLDPPQPQADPNRARVVHQNPGVQGGQPRHAVAIEQGVEAAWERAAAGQQRPAAISNPTGQVSNPVAEPNSGARANNPEEPKTTPTDPAPSSTMHPTGPAGVEANQPGEDVPDWRGQPKGEVEKRGWRKFLNFVRGK